MSQESPIRARLLAAMASHVLRHGLHDASLRPLAKAAGTSDRMLLYHFGTKEALVAALLVQLATDFEAALTRLAPGGGFASADEAVSRLVAWQQSPPLAGYVRVWLEIVAASAAGSAVHRRTASAILSGLVGWLEQRLPGPRDAVGRDARAAIARIEGELVLWSIGWPGGGEGAVAAGDATPSGRGRPA